MSKLKTQTPPQPPYSHGISSDVVDEFRAIQKSKAGTIRSFVDIDTGTNIRSTFTRDHYEYYRPEEALPYKQKSIIAYCADAYRRVGPLYNIINLMADFASQGIKLVHRSPQVQKFYREWFKKVNGKERSERFANLILRMGTVIPLRVTAQISNDELKKWRRSVAKADMVLDDEPPVDKNEIPFRYIFLNPLSVEVLSPGYAAFTSSPRYALRLARSFSDQLSYADNEDKEVLKTVPERILKAIKDGNQLIPLDPAKTSVYFYKKDDWQLWADPLANVVLDDIILLEKMKLCDLSAVDGSISAVRLWTIGDLTTSPPIFPTRATIARLNQQLTNNVGGGVQEFIWGPELKFKESESNSYRYLGKAKYEAVYEAINQGLGIPSAMSGNAGAGFTNNYIQLKTLVERLQYVRNILVMFWEKEIAIVQEALGLRHAASVHFDKMMLNDEAAEKKLLIDMADRDMISLETVLERCGEIPEIEKLRLRREGKLRIKGGLPVKSGPYHNADKEHDLRKLFVQLGVVTPSEMGIALEENKDGEKTSKEQDIKAAKLKGPPAGSTSPKGIPGQGRPKNSRDIQPRKKKRVLPSTKGAPLYAWTYDAQNKIAEFIEPVLRGHFGKSNLRKFTKEEFDLLEKFKASILYSLEVFTQVDEIAVGEAFHKTKGEVDGYAQFEFDRLHTNFVETLNRQPSLEEVKQMRGMAYMISKVDFVD